MSLRQKLFTVFGLMLAVVVLSGGRAEAAKTYNGETHTPTAHRTLCNAGTPVDFSGYPSNVSLNLNTGVMSYNINVRWSNCNTAPNRAYAIYSLGSEVCPMSGTYGASGVNNGFVTDCVKYIGSPPYQGPGNGLSCSVGIFGIPGTNEQCVNGNFGAVRRAQNQPSGLNSEVIPMQTVIPNWGTMPDTGSWTIENDMCQYYKMDPPGYNTHVNNRCIKVRISVSWTETVVQPVISCGSVTTNPAAIEEGQSFALTAGFTLNGGQGAISSTNYTIRLTLPAAGIHNQVIAQNQPIAWTSGAGSGTLPNVTIPGMGVFPVSYTVSVENASNTPRTCSGSVRIVKRPYLSVYGADVKAGGAFAGGNCLLQANIRANSNPGMGGSGVEFAAMALGTVSGFNSARLRSAAPQPPSGLTFANTGGIFGRLNSANCVPDYFVDGDSLTPNNSPTIDLTSLVRGSHKFTNGATMTLSGQVQGNNRINLYVQGNLRITDNISFATSNWNTPNDIPSLRVYVRGNIYIESDVTQIDGVYVAQPDGTPNSGTIVTCVTPGTNTPVATGQLAQQCGQQLRINGAFISQRVRFLRAANSMRSAGPNEATAAGSQAAEVFYFTPDIFIAAPQPTPGSETDQIRFDSFTGLPPIL